MRTNHEVKNKFFLTTILHNRIEKGKNLKMFINLNRIVKISSKENENKSNFQNRKNAYLLLL